jgi:hypothetical protein
MQSRLPSRNENTSQPNEIPSQCVEPYLYHMTVNDKSWKHFANDWVELPGNIGTTDMSATFAPET